MRICVPVEEDKGLDSRVCEHFGSAPAFLLVDTRTKRFDAIVNAQSEHAHGGCAPLGALLTERVDAFVVKGIGRGALQRVLGAGVAAFQTSSITVNDVVAEAEAGALAAVEATCGCGQHGHGDHHH
jgi:predicted Fe-Mo cluster-binding NifX family protein